jgi:hypothetical protein
MSRLNSAAISFATAVFGLSIVMYAAHAPFSDVLFFSCGLTLAFASLMMFRFMQQALLYLREGESEVAAKAPESQNKTG